MNTFKHTFTGGEHFWIRFHDGTCEVRKKSPDGCDDNETVFKGHYAACAQYIENLVIENADYDLNL